MQTSYDVGDAATLAVELRDDDAALTDATVTLSITLPDGTTSTPSVSHISTGVYQASFTTTLPGLHQYRWAASGALVSAENDSFHVLPTSPGFIISLAEAKQALNLTDDDTYDDDELRTYVAAASVVVGMLDRSYVAESKTWKTSGGRASVVLPDSPIVSVTSIETSDGVTLPATAYAVDEDAGIIDYLTGCFPVPYAVPRANDIEVTYVVGDSVVPANVRLAARELVRHWFQRGQYSPRPGFGDDGTDDVSYVAGYAIPNFVVGMLQPGSGK